MTDLEPQVVLRPGSQLPIIEIQQYITQRGMRERAAIEEERLKAFLLDRLDVVGEEDDAGHKTIDMPVPLHAFLNEKATKVRGIKRQRRVSQNLNVDRAREVAEKYGVLDRCLHEVTVEEFDESALLGANFEGIIPDADLESCYEETEAFSFVPLQTDG